MGQVRITNLKGQREIINLPAYLNWEGRFPVGLGHTLITMYEHVRGKRCFLRWERTAKDREWREVDRGMYEEYVAWIMRDIDAGHPIPPYRRHQSHSGKVAAGKAKGRGLLGALLCLVFLTSCGNLVTPPMHLMPAYPAGEAAKQQRIAEKETWPGGWHPYPAALLAPISPTPYVRPLDPHRPWDSCSIYGMDLSAWQALQPGQRDRQRFISHYRGYQDRNLRTKAPVQLPGIGTHPATGGAPTSDDVQRGMNWEDQYDYGGDGNYLGGGGGYLP